MHVFPQLRKLEHKYSNELAVIGVHSAKFPSERLTENLRMAVMRFELKHPVINDSNFRVWGQWGCRAWPTLMFIDPQGRVVGKHEGEITFDDFDRLIGDMVQEFDGKGLLNRTPLVLKTEKDVTAALSFPGKVLADGASQRLFIADSSAMATVRIPALDHLSAKTPTGTLASRFATKSRPTKLAASCWSAPPRDEDGHQINQDDRPP